MKTIRCYCPRCERRLSIAELLERFCEACEADITPSEAPKKRAA